MMLRIVTELTGNTWVAMAYQGQTNGQSDELLIGLAWE
jgi:hypothetical protein